MRKHLKRQSIVALLLAGIMILQDTQGLLACGVDFVSGLPRFVSFDAPDALRDASEVILLEDEQEALTEDEIDNLLDEQLQADSTENTEIVDSTESASGITNPDTIIETEASTEEQIIEEQIIEEQTTEEQTTEEQTTEEQATEEQTTEEQTTEEQTTEETDTEEEATEEEESLLREPIIPEEQKAPGEIVSYSEDSITYALGEGQYQTVFGSNVGTYTDDSGIVQLEDNTLQEIATFSSEEGSMYINTANDYTVAIPEIMTGDTGMMLEQDGYVVEIIPLDGDYTKAVVKENAILYNDVYENIDVQYTVQGKSIKEDIILRAPGCQNVFKYQIKTDGLTAILDGQTVILSNVENTQIFALAAPYMTDATGEVSLGVVLSLDETEAGTILTVTADSEWLSDESRTYPVKIDPSQIYLEPTKFGLYCVEEGSPSRVIGDNNYPYIGYDDGIKSGNLRLYNSAHERCRTYVSIDYDFTELGESAMISGASLRICQSTHMSGGGVDIGLYSTDEAWESGSLTWNSQIGMNHTFLNSQSTTSSANDYIEFDITDYVNNCVQGISTDTGLVLKYLDEYAQCEVFHNRNSSNYGPQIVVYWGEGGDDPYLAELPLDSLTINLRPMTEKNANGKLTFDGVFADGLATSDATVSYYLNTDGAIGTTTALSYYAYPNGMEYLSIYPNATRYKSLESNWQSTLYHGLSCNVLYQIRATATKDGATSTIKQSDNFVIYRATSYDTFPKIAAYYGVDLNTILRDNRVQDTLIVGGNTIFVRNPSTTVPYVSTGLSAEEMRQIDGALLGRGINCEFGFEPINLNTGNFYMNLQDVAITDIGRDFAINRSYNSIGAGIYSPFGYGWTFDYDEYLAQNEDGTILYKRGDGSYLYFTEDSDGSYHAEAGFDYVLTPYYADGTIASWSLIEEDYTEKKFNSYGMLQSVTDVYGNQTTITYDAAYHLEKITSPSGKEYGFTTDAQGRITAVVLPNDAILSYTYDEAGNLTSYVNANGDVISYEYNDMHRMLRWFDANGNRIVDNQYDEKGRVTAQTDAEGNIATLSYSDGKTITTDNNGNQTTYYYNQNNYTTKIVYADGSIENKTYTADNRLSTETDGEGNTTSYTYDSNGNLLTITRADGTISKRTYNDRNQLLVQTDYNGNKTSYSYDAKGNLTDIVYADGSSEHYSYDSSNRLVEITDGNGNKQTYTYEGAMPVIFTDREGNTYHYTYNTMNLLLEEKDPLGNRVIHLYDLEGREIQTIAEDGGSTTYEFDKAGNVLSITDARGKKTAFTYDKAGNILSGTDPAGNTLTYEYDKNYNKIKEINSLGGITTFAYDAKNRLILQTDANGNQTSYQYDKNGNLISETNPLGNSTYYTYNTIQNVKIAEIDANGNSTHYSYDAYGNLTKITYPDGGVEANTYDSRNRMVSTTDVLGLITTYSYDDAGNFVKEENSLGEITTYQYNRNQQLTRETDALSHTASYTYDIAGRVASFTDKNGNTTSYAYDAVGRLIITTNAMGDKETVSYDLNGNVTAVTDEAGNTTSYTYDAINRLTSQTSANGAITAYHYDALSRLVKITDALKGETTYTYDAVGNMVTKVDANGNKTTYTYDKANQISAITLPNKSTSNMTYDKVGNLISLTDVAGLQSVYTYDSNNRVIAEADNTGKSNHYTLDYAGNTLKQVDALGRTITYRYDSKGRQITVTEADGSTTSYEYDALNNLIQVTDAMGQNTAFTYDAVGNNLTMAQTEEKIYSYSYDKLNRLVTEKNPLGGITTYHYNAVGNLLQLTDANGNKKTYTYDTVSNMTSETDGNGNTTIYGYDALNRMTLKKDALGNKAEYRYDAIGNLTKYRDEKGYITEYRYDSVSNMVKTISPLGAVETYTYDNHGNVISHTDALGNKTAYTVDLNGNVTTLKQADGGVYTYTYDVAGRLTSTTTPLDYVVKMTYDKVDNMIKETDSMNRVTTYEYDALHHMIKTTDAEGGISVYTYDTYGNLCSESDPLGRTTNYIYDLCDRMTEMSDPLNQLTSIDYDPVGNVISITTPGSRTTSYSYDGNYNEVSTTDPMGYVTAYLYDKKNQLIAETDALSQKNHYTYDVLGQVIEYTDRRGNSERYSYDAHGNQTVYVDYAGKVTRYSYDLNNNLLSVEDAGGGKTYYEYDSMNRMTAYINALGNTTLYTYDYTGNQLTVTDEAGRTEKSIYDEAGRLTEFVKNSGTAIHYDYDKLNELIEKSYSDSEDNTIEESVLYGYNAAGERVSMMDLTGDSTYEYDALGRIIKVTNGAGKMVTYAYDEAENLTELGYPDGTYVLYTYDLNNNITSVTEPDGDKTTYTYDALNRLKVTTRPDHTATYMSYDEEGNLTSLINKCNECDEIISEYQYTYNEMGYVLTETATERVSVYCSVYHGPGKDHGNYWHGNGHHNCQHEWFEYDSRLEEQRNEHNQQNDNHSSLSTIIGSIIDKLIGNRGEIRRYLGRWHHRFGLECSCHTVLIHTTKSYVYDQNHQVISCTTDKDNCRRTTEIFTYDEAGNRTSYEKWYGYSRLEYIRYEYNSANQMVASYVRDGWWWDTTTYEYDPDGNLISKAIGDEPNLITTRYTYDAENRLRAVTEKGVLLQAMTYDGDGNLAYQLALNTDTLVDGRNIYFPIYDYDKAERALYSKVANRYGWVSAGYTLTEYLNDVTKENVEVLAEYGKNYCSMTVYTYGNERISATTFNGYLYHYGCHEHNVSHIHDDLWNITSHKNYRNQERYRDYSNKQYQQKECFASIYGSCLSYNYGRYCGHRWTSVMSKMYYLYDGHGSVERVHGKDGSSCKLMYDTYGNLTAGIIEQWNIWYNDIFAHRTTMIYAYSGEAYNCISELQYLRARWYDTESGRFLSEDRYLGNQRQPLTRNRYLYTCNNPMNYVDPSGYKAVAQDVGGFGVMRQSALTGGFGLALAALLEETKKKAKAQKNTNRQNNNSSDKQSSTSQTLTNTSSSPLAGVTQATMDSLAQKVEEAKNRQENDLCEGSINKIVDQSNVLSYSMNLVEYLKRFETFRNEKYKALETEKYYTIGYGHYCDSPLDEQYLSSNITEEEATQLLLSDIEEEYPTDIISIVNRTHGELKQYELDALVSLAFNCGEFNSLDSTVFLELLSQKEYKEEDIVREFYTYISSGGNIAGGLVKRRTAEAILFLKGDYLEDIDDLYGIEAVEIYKAFMIEYGYEYLIEYIEGN